LKFTPQVFPNLDVQVKMSIESKDVLGAGTLTPTFTERTITGTARVQNNRTMMLASVSQDTESNGRKGLPLVGLIPILGRMFTTPTRDNRQVDIVIAVTPRVLRAPAVTPRDEEMRPSGTLQSPTTGSLEAMIRDSDREEAIAAARRLPRNAVVEVRDVEPAPFSPGNTTAPTVAQNDATKTQSTSAASTATVNTQPTTTPSDSTQTAKAQAPAEELPTFVPAPKSLVSDSSAAQVAAVNGSNMTATNAVLTSLPVPIDAAVTRSRTAIFSLPAEQTLAVGEKRQIAIELNSEVPLGLAVVTLRFDPKVVSVRAVTKGGLFTNGKAPSITESIDPTGVCLISISTLNGASPMTGNGVLVILEIEGIAAGDAALSFDQGNMHLVATDARDVKLDVKQGRTTVKQ
jgi:general secretion pathway protein D